MHNLGILNLSFAPIDEKDELQQAMTEKRSLVCRLREANKKIKQLTTRNNEVEETLIKTKMFLGVAESQVTAFRVDHPEWTPPDNLLLSKDHQEDFTNLFQVHQSNEHTYTRVLSQQYFNPLIVQVLDKEVVDVEKQMQIDPTGMLTLFWQEQKRMLHRKSGQIQWNPKVCTVTIL